MQVLDDLVRWGKVRYVADLVRGKNVDKALAQLRFSKRDAARDLEKLVRAAVANAEHMANRDNQKIDIDSLYVTKVWVDEGSSPMMVAVVVSASVVATTTLFWLTW